MKNAFAFAADSITVNGKIFPARYELTAEAVNVFAAVEEDGKTKTVCIRICAEDTLYTDALAAAQPMQAAQEVEQAAPEAEQTAQEVEQTEPEAEQTEPEAEQAAQEAEQTEPEAEQTEPEAEQTEPEAEQTEPEAEQAAPEAEQVAPEEEQAAQEAEQTAPEAEQAGKAARAVPEKSFIGQVISGAGWAIIFDGGCNRTRVIIAKGYRDKLRGIIEGAGFYYSAALDSWNKKLTFRAYRAAQALAQDLTAATA